MRRFSHAFNVESKIDRVWSFYTNLKHLEIITPKQFRLRVVHSSTGTDLNAGSVVTLEGRFGLLNLRWKSRITTMRPQQEYVDEMLSGLFKLWKHSHKFVDLGSSTQVLDEIVFSFGYPGVGPILEKFALWQLDKIFSYRKVATLSALEIQSAK